MIKISKVEKKLTSLTFDGKNNFLMDLVLVNNIKPKYVYKIEIQDNY